MVSNELEPMERTCRKNRRLAIRDGKQGPHANDEIMTLYLARTLVSAAPDETCANGSTISPIPASPAWTDMKS